MGQSDSRASSGDRSAVRGYRKRSVQWVLLTGDRRIVALGFVGLFAAFFVLLETLGFVPLADTQALFYAYSSLIGGNLTLITVIVSINQLLLSRELQTPNEVRTQIESVVEYREIVESATNEVAPVKPQGFLRLLLEATREQAQQLGGFAKDGVVESGNEEIDDVVQTLTEQLDRVDELLVESETDIFSVLSLLLETNYAEQINRLRTIRANHGSGFSTVVHDSIDDLIDRLQEIDIARQYFKSIFMKQELSSLSRVLLYAGLPAVATALAALLVLTIPSGEPTAVPALSLLVPITITLGLLPLALLCSFFLRTATITKLTAATLPFTTQEQER